MEKDLEHTIAGRIRETEDGSLHWIVRSMHSDKKYKKNSKTILSSVHWSGLFFP